MDRRIFTQASPYKKQARFAAVVWTLLIFIACLTPAKDIPDVPVPLIDKWTHFVLFGVFAFLLLLSNPTTNTKRLILVFFTAFVLGSLIELLQGYFASLGRSCDIMDALADAIGGAIGVITFYLIARRNNTPAKG
jgi:VanZ family protein